MGFGVGEDVGKAVSMQVHGVGLLVGSFDGVLEGLEVGVEVGDWVVGGLDETHDPFCQIEGSCQIPTV